MIPMEWDTISDPEIHRYELLGPITGFVIITPKFHLESRHFDVIYFQSQDSMQRMLVEIL